MKLNIAVLPSSLSMFMSISLLVIDVTSTKVTTTNFDRPASINNEEMEIDFEGNLVTHDDDSHDEDDYDGEWEEDYYEEDEENWEEEEFNREEEEDAPGSQDCDDNEKDCDMWAKGGECEANPGFMLLDCRKSCKVCHLNENYLEERIEREIEFLQEKEEREKEEREERARYFGLEQILPHKIHKDWWQKSVKYMREIVFEEDRYNEVRADCQNQHKECTVWATEGDCEQNTEFMKLECAVACKTCESLIFSERCPWDKNKTKDAFGPGDLNAMFERIVSNQEWIDRGLAILSRDPWVVTIDNFTSYQECDKLIKFGESRGFERSEDVGDKKPDGSYDSIASEARTSLNSWCDQQCLSDPLSMATLNRIEKLTGIDDSHSEYLQLLKYHPGQYYVRHHDYIEFQEHRAEGVRILTVFLYLNDVEVGGATDFPELNITVTPQKGRLLLWPSVLNEAPNLIDERTDHQALQVEKGVKFGANAWIHMRDYKEPHERGCA